MLEKIKERIYNVGSSYVRVSPTQRQLTQVMQLYKLNLTVTITWTQNIGYAQDYGLSTGRVKMTE